MEHVSVASSAASKIEPLAHANAFYVEWWGAKRMNMKLPPNCEAHLNHMMARPAVQRVLQQEGVA